MRHHGCSVAIGRAKLGERTASSFSHTAPSRLASTLFNMGPACSRLSGPALISINAGALEKCIEGCRACAPNDQLSHGGFN